MRLIEDGTTSIQEYECITVKQTELTEETIDKIAERVVAKLGEKLK